MNNVLLVVVISLAFAAAASIDKKSHQEKIKKPVENKPVADSDNVKSTTDLEAVKTEEKVELTKKNSPVPEEDVTDEAVEEVGRKKKSVTSFCVQIKPSGYQPIQLCEQPMSAYSQPQPVYSSYNAIPSAPVPAAQPAYAAPKKIAYAAAAPQPQQTQEAVYVVDSKPSYAPKKLVPYGSSSASAPKPSYQQPSQSSSSSSSSYGQPAESSSSYRSKNAKETTTLMQEPTETEMAMSSNSAQTMLRDSAQMMSTDSALLMPTNSASMMPSNSPQTMPRNSAQMMSIDSALLMPTNSAPMMSTNSALLMPTNSVPMMSRNSVQMPSENIAGMMSRNTPEASFFPFPPLTLMGNEEMTMPRSANLVQNLESTTDNEMKMRYAPTSNSYQKISYIPKPSIAENILEKLNKKLNILSALTVKCKPTVNYESEVPQYGASESPVYRSAQSSKYQSVSRPIYAIVESEPQATSSSEPQNANSAYPVRIYGVPAQENSMQIIPVVNPAVNEGPVYENPSQAQEAAPSAYLIAEETRYVPVPAQNSQQPASVYIVAPSSYSANPQPSSSAPSSPYQSAPMPVIFAPVYQKQNPSPAKSMYAAPSKPYAAPSKPYAAEQPSPKPYASYAQHAPARQQPRPTPAAAAPAAHSYSGQPIKSNQPAPTRYSPPGTYRQSETQATSNENLIEHADDKEQKTLEVMTQKSKSRTAAAGGWIEEVARQADDNVVENITENVPNEAAPENSETGGDNKQNTAVQENVLNNP